MPYCTDHTAERVRIAAGLKVTGPKKRAEAQARAKLTRERNKAKKAAKKAHESNSTAAFEPAARHPGAEPEAQIPGFTDGLDSDEEEGFHEEVFALAMARSQQG
jgi:hypothetical protein